MPRPRRSSVPLHPFGELLTQYRLRKRGLLQGQLAELAGYDPSIIIRMTQGKKDLTGPSGRERILRLAEVLHDQGVLTSLDEINALLLTATLPPLFDRAPGEARLIARITKTTGRHLIRRTNLPAALTSFIGRAREIADVRDALAATRLLTLTGAAGVGKTRLAQRVAGDVLLLYAEGVWYSELAPLADASLIEDTVARALGIAMRDNPPLETLIDFLRDRHTLLVLDNCEHLIDAVAVFALAVLSACPRVTFLLTSRDALDLTGETNWQVPPLPPDDAAQLFIAHARAARRDAALGSPGSIDPHVQHICARLDGIPLAIEMVAAQVATRTVAEIALALDEQLSLRLPGRREVPARQRTLRATLDWSYRLLSPADQWFLSNAGVFAGGFSLEAAQAVCAPVAAPPDQALNAIRRLVRASLVLAEQHGEVTRYRLLESVRQYAREVLIERAALEETRARHARYYLNLAEQQLDQSGAQLRRWIQTMHTTVSNLRVAFAWACEHAAADAGDAALRLSARARTIIFDYGSARECRQWLVTALELGGGAPPAARARCMRGYGRLLCDSFEYVKALEVLDEALHIFEQTGESLDLAWALMDRSLVASDHEHNVALAIQLGEQALAVLVRQQSPLGMLQAQSWLGSLQKMNDDPTAALRMHEASLRTALEFGFVDSVTNSLEKVCAIDETRGLALWREWLPRIRASDVPLTRSSGLIWFAATLCGIGRSSEGRPMAQESLAIAGQYPDEVPWHVLSFIHHVLAQIAYFLNDFADSESHFAQYAELYEAFQRDAPVELAMVSEFRAYMAHARGELEEAIQLSLHGLRQAMSSPFVVRQALSMAPVGRFALLRGDAALAGQLLGQVAQHERTVIKVAGPPMRIEFGHTMSLARERLADPVFAAAWEAGGAMTLADAAALVI